MFYLKELSVRNHAIDTEHKCLHDTLAALSEKIAKVEVSSIPVMFGLLDTQLQRYFKIEEEIARVINFDFTLHQFSHQCLLTEIGFCRYTLMAKGCILSKSEMGRCADFLMNCLIRHVEEDSQLLKLALETHPYHLKLN